jgi:hypothetical protein
MAKAFFLLVFVGVVCELGCASPVLPGEVKRPELKRYPSLRESENELEILDRLANKIQELQKIRMSQYIKVGAAQDEDTLSRKSTHPHKEQQPSKHGKLVVTRVRQLASQHEESLPRSEGDGSRRNSDDDEGAYSLRKFELRTTLGDLAILESLSAKIQDLKDMRKMESVKTKADEAAAQGENDKTKKKGSSLAGPRASLDTSRNENAKTIVSSAKVQSFGGGQSEAGLVPSSMKKETSDLEGERPVGRKETRGADADERAGAEDLKAMQEECSITRKACENCGSRCKYP